MRRAGCCPSFLIVSNMELDDPKLHRRRQRARGAPAPGRREVLLRAGQEGPADRSHARDWRSVVYHAKLGSQADRIERVRALARAIAAALGVPADTADRAAALSKADLLTGMVGEFPELQGVMGRYYAAHDGEAPQIAQAIAEHYQPRFAGDALPASGDGHGGRAGGQARDARGHLGNRPAAHRRPGSVRAAPARAGHRADARREVAAAVADRAGRAGLRCRRPARGRQAGADRAVGLRRGPHARIPARPGLPRGRRRRRARDRRRPARPRAAAARRDRRVPPAARSREPGGRQQADRQHPAQVGPSARPRSMPRCCARTASTRCFAPCRRPSRWRASGSRHWTTPGPHDAGGAARASRRVLRRRDGDAEDPGVRANRLALLRGCTA